MTGSEPYRQFLRAFLEEPQRDVPDVQVLDELDPGERERAEQVLLARLPGSLDAMSGLSHLRSARAIDPLREVMRHQHGAGAVHAAIALWEIAQDEEAFALLCQVLEERPRLRRTPGRLDAAAALTRHDRREAIAALITALDDRDIAVSANAAQGVRERLRLNAEADAMRSGHLTLSQYRTLARAALEREYGAGRPC